MPMAENVVNAALYPMLLTSIPTTGEPAACPSDTAMNGSTGPREDRPGSRRTPVIR